MLIKFVHSELQALGIEYLSAVLKEHGHRAQLIIDPYFPFLKSIGYFMKNLLNYKRLLLKKIFSDNPDLIAFSITSYNMEWACNLSRELKKCSSVPIVFGGMQATLIPEIILEKSGADFIVLGEGERSLLGLVESMKDGERDFRINNVWVKKEGRLLKNPLGEVIDNLDVLPFPDKELLPYWLNRGLYRIITGRGCPDNCSYCCAPLQRKIYKGKGNFIRHRSGDNVIKELKKAKLKYKIRRVLFEDDLFTYNKEWVREFSQQYKKEVAVPCFIHASPETLDDEMVKLLKEMMCYSVELGVQSFNQKIRRDVLNRYYTNRQIRDIVLLLKKNRINCICDNIIGLPQENETDIMDMVKFYNKMRPGKVEVLRLEYYPKAPIIEKAGIPKEMVKKIDKGELIISKGKNPVETAKAMFLLGLSYIFPPKIISYILHKRLYRLLPYVYDFNHLNEFIFYLSSIFKRDRHKAFISLRADVLYKLRYMIANFLFRDNNGKNLPFSYIEAEERN